MKILRWLAGPEPVKERGGEHGAALVEFALVLPLFMAVFVGITDYAIYIHQEMELTEAAAAGAAFGAIPGQQENTAGMQSSAQQAAPDVSGLTVTATYFYSCTPGGASVGSTGSCPTAFGSNPLMYVQVKTSATVPALLRWPGISNSLTLRGQSTYRVPWTQ